MPGLRLQIDYFDISIEDAIQAPNADFSLLMCALNGDPSTCARVQRDRDGSLFNSNAGFVVDTFENIGEIATSGIDLDASYAFDIGAGGRLGFDFVGTMLDSLEFTPQDGVTYDCAGLYGAVCGVPAPGVAAQAGHDLAHAVGRCRPDAELALLRRGEARCGGLERVPVVPRHGDRPAGRPTPGSAAAATST